MNRYPVTSRTSIIHCPVHDCAVALNDDGRISSLCPHCLAEARKGRRNLLARIRRRQS